MNERLLQRAAIIRDEQQENANSALRVGRLFIDMLQQDDAMMQRIDSFSKEVQSWRWLRTKRGAWDSVTAAISPYRFFDKIKVSKEGFEYNQTCQDTVFRYGCEWGCIKDKTLNPPEFNCSDWMVIDGKDAYYLDFISSNGFQFFQNKLDTVVTAYIYHNAHNITDMVMADANTKVVWSRDTGFDAADRSWAPSLVDNFNHVIHLTDADMGSGWMTKYRQVRFICEVYINIGDVAVPISLSINFKS